MCLRKHLSFLSSSFSDMQRSLFSVVMLPCNGMPELTSPIVIFTSLLGGAGPGICRERPRSFGYTAVCNVYTRHHEGSYECSCPGPTADPGKQSLWWAQPRELSQLHRCSAAQPGVRTIGRKDPGSQDSEAGERQGLQGDPFCS